MNGVLFIGFGGPEKREDIMPFLEITTRGRGIPPERLKEVAHHYEAIGGASPINAITNRQAAGLRKLISEPVYVGNRNWHPFLEDTLKKMAADGVKRAVGFVTAAHRSEASWERYIKAVDEARGRVGVSAPAIDYVQPWFDHPLFIEAVCERIREISPSPELRPPSPLSRERDFSPSPYLREKGLGDEGVLWVFTAHSIPISMAEGSRYVLELERAAALVAERFGRKEWRLAYTSRSGRPQDPWLEPDVCDVLREEARRGQRSVLVIPIGFVADHVEVLFDLDVEAKAAAKEAGIHLFRAKTVGDHPLFIQMIADVIRKRVTTPA